MDEAISKASVCEILADMYPTDGEKVVSVESIDEAYDKIIKLPTIWSEQQWIPCSERLPEHDDEYIVTRIVSSRGDKWVGLKWYSTKHGWEHHERISAWMSLPENYEEDKS